MLNVAKMTPIKMLLTAAFVVAASLVQTGVVSAEACTYREAIMAMETGNHVRGLALMRMASRDGDQRAEKFLMARSPVETLPEFSAVGERVLTARAE